MWVMYEWHKQHLNCPSELVGARPKGASRTASATASEGCMPPAGSNPNKRQTRDHSNISGSFAGKFSCFAATKASHEYLAN
ncbi:hypothetical protein PRIPAC_78000 [Pristionchus pacificus]|uniref:Uncharacterized protein n=1 Tax=Pristionchus pacificus TaxID=54126 RepID=A0A2A6BYK2_PRIPA|nr:hypothetical protein PRIPAC_78000 [Pristionchus pacificus]|eukprot:PDM71024.1 hypothetical protein PRIPAC_44420 [Pristionchus pacificus]